MTLVNLNRVSFSHGGPPLLADVDCGIDEGERVGLVGRNGTGKSTLLQLIAGAIAPTAGEVARRTDLSIAELPQRLPDLAGLARDVVAAGLRNGERLVRYHRLVHALPAHPSAAQLAEIDRLHHELERDGEFTRESEIERVLQQVGVEPEADCGRLSVGGRRRVLLARALVSSPDLLLLDEPTNHLDIGAIENLEEFLVRMRGSLLFVTHDRVFIRRVATRVLSLDRGRVKNYTCGYDEFVQRRDADLEAEALETARADKKLEQEEAWARQGVKARRTRAAARVRALEGLRADRRARKEKIGAVKAALVEAERSGDLVIDTKDVSFSWPTTAEPASERAAERPILRALTTSIFRGDKIGVIGKNGSGKTTLLRILLGELAPTSGTVRHGTRLEIAYFDQLHARVDESKTVAENVTAGDFVTVGGSRRHVVGFLGDFLFRPEQVRASVKDLSGGERSRLLLARLFTRPSNLLVLDEPTNDLDAETVEVLEDLLVAYTGTILLVSHDREFLNRVVTSTLVLEGDGSVGEFVGGYDDWLRQRGAARPARDGKPDRDIAAPKSDRPAPARTRKRTYRETQELEALPARIEALESERAALHERMADPAAFARDAAAFGRARDRLPEIERELKTAYARWEELESIGDSAGGRVTP